MEQDVATFWSLLFAVVSDGEKRLMAHMAAHHLTPPQFYVLKTLVEQGGQYPIGEIARNHHLTNATMTGLVKRLEVMNPPLVQRQRNPQDLRSVDVVITEAGRERFLAVQADVLAQLSAVLQLVNDEDRKTLIEFFSRYVDAVTNLFPVENIRAPR